MSALPSLTGGEGGFGYTFSEFCLPARICLTSFLYTNGLTLIVLSSLPNHTNLTALGHSSSITWLKLVGMGPSGTEYATLPAWLLALAQDWPWIVIRDCLGGRF